MWWFLVVVMMRLVVMLVVSDGMVAVGAYQQWGARETATGRRVCGRIFRARLGEVMREGTGRGGLIQRDF